MAIIHANPALLSDYFKLIDFDDPEIMKTLYAPSITQQIMDHRIDALAYSLSGSRGQHDRAEVEKRIANMRNVYRYHGQYIDPERPHSAYQRLFNPEFVDKFIWGPRGEFTGIVKDEDAVRQFNNSPTGKWRQKHFTLHMKISLIPYEDELIEWGDPRFYQMFGQHNHYYTGSPPCHQLIQFENYRDLVEYHSFINQDYGRANGYTELVHELAGLLQNIRPMRSALTDWMDALKKTKATFGFGCLHDGEGNMDPLGVLADVNGCEWVWEKKEGAYKVKGGDAYSLPDKVLREYLGIPDDTLTRHVSEFQTRFPEIMDRYTTFNQVNADLLNALDLITWRLNDVRRMRNSTDGLDTIQSGPTLSYDGEDSVSFRRWDILPERQISRSVLSNDFIRLDRRSSLINMDWT